MPSIKERDHDPFHNRFGTDLNSKYASKLPKLLKNSYLNLYYEDFSTAKLHF